MALPKPMKPMKPMKTGMKKSTMKGKKVSKVAKGPRAKAVVMQGYKEKTATGITKAMLTVNKRGKIVTKKQAAAGKRAYAANIAAFHKAVMKARHALGLSGFIAIKGKTP